jgi:hypothetical protein
MQQCPSDTSSSPSGDVTQTRPDDVSSSQPYVPPPDLYTSFNPWRSIKSRGKKYRKFSRDSDSERLAIIHDSEFVPVHESQREELRLMKSIQQHRHDAILCTPTVPSQADIVAGLEKLSTDTRAESAIAGQMLQHRKKHANAFWKARYLPPTVDPKKVYPSTSELIKRSAFGKPNFLKTYTVIPAFSHILLPVLKREYLTKSDLKNFFKAMPAAQYLYGRIIALRHLDFRALRHPNFDWEAKEVNTDRQLLREAAILHYDGWFQPSNCTVEGAIRAPNTGSSSYWTPPDIFCRTPPLRR